MNLRNRFGTTIAIVTLGALGAAGMAACSSPAPAVTSMSPEATALTALGFSDGDVTTTADGTVDATVQYPGVAATGTPTASGKADGSGVKRLRRLLIRRGLGRNVEHGSVTIQTKNNGVQTVDIQRGTITAITDTTVTVKSTDGFTLTWTFGSPIRIIEHRSTVQPGNVVVGETVGVAGIHAGSTETARLMVIPNQTTK